MYDVIERKIELEGKVEAVYGLQHEDGTAIEDVSPNRAVTYHVAEYYTKMKVSSRHLADVVSDMLDTPEGFDNYR